MHITVPKNKKADGGVLGSKAIVWILAVAAAVTLSAANCSVATHYVSQNSPTPTPPYSTPDTAAHTIQEAVDVGSDGDTVSVEPGDYGLTNQVTVTMASACKEQAARARHS